MFVYKYWEDFCRKLDSENIHSNTAQELLEQKKQEFLILKHDVETNPSKALALAKLEAKYGHKGVYYIQAYLLNKKENIEILKEIQSLGHEVSYHHDVLDSSSGDIKAADKCFAENLRCFEENGFKVITVCQHGNPVIERNGYYSNRDFFRNTDIQKKYSDISEIMVNYRERIGTDFKYISDAGYGWKIIFDPETNDITDSSDKDILLENLDEVIKSVKEHKAMIVSTHPHRWYSNSFIAITKNCVFKAIKITAKTVMKIPFMKRLMGRFYFLAKKI